jgi:ParB-like chromosome segregation protein Spo0J
MNLFDNNNNNKIDQLIDDLCQEINKIQDIDTRINTINAIRKKITTVSPLKNHPVDCVIWEKIEHIKGNEYNPNKVAPPEFKLLIKSIEEDGFTMPCPTYYLQDKNVYEIVDGFNRNKTIFASKKIGNNTYFRLPITHIRDSQTDINNRMASTIRHNRARGTHNIDLMVNIVRELTEIGMTDNWIMKHIGMDADEILRLKQLSGLAALFKDKEFSDSWENNDSY